MTRSKSYFNKLTEDMHFHIEKGDDGRYQVEDIGTVRFERASGNTLFLRYFFYVQGLKKNLFSVSALEIKGYQVTFRQGRDFIKPTDSNVAKQIGVRQKNLYRLLFETVATFTNMDGRDSSKELGDIA